MKHSINQYFDAVFCINLKRRLDRRAQAEAEFRRFGIEVEFLDAVDGQTLNFPPTLSSDKMAVSNGDYGCTLSHLNAVIQAKGRGLKNYFVFEDDVEMVNNFNELFPLYMEQLPTNYDMIYLGGSHEGALTKINDFTYKMTKTLTTHAFGCNASIYDKMIDVLSKIEKVDLNISSLHADNNCYVFRPHLAFQREGHSDILNRHTNYEHLRK